VMRVTGDNGDSLSSESYSSTDVGKLGYLGYIGVLYFDCLRLWNFGIRGSLRSDIFVPFRCFTAA
jgi:hypothetical protein